jgi:LPS-assembly protein
MVFRGLNLLCAAGAILIAVAAAPLWPALTAELPANLPNDETPILLLADTVSYDQELGVVTASGNVEVSQGDYVLLADNMTYTEATEVVTATGNVVLIDPNGDVIFSDFAELTGDLREGAIQGIRLLLADGSRLAAASAVRTEGNRTVLNRGVYSPCNLCEEDRMAPPLWQIKAVRVVHNQETQRIEYRDAWLEIYGVPVFYTPYFSHPDPTVERQSGFLAPTLGSNRNTGFTIQPSYYWTISPSEDLTFSPIITTGAGIVPLGEYRRRTRNGIMNIELSGTITDREDTDNGQQENHQNEFRGHIDAFGRFDINEHWRWGFDVQAASDKTYLRLYDLSNAASLTSRAFTEGFYGQNYAAVNAYYFQGLTDEDDNSQSPIVAPWSEYHHVTEPGWLGSHFNFDTSMMSLNRIEGRDSTRFSVGGAWTLPYVGSIGEVYRLTASVRADAYRYQNVDPNSNDADPSGPTESGFDARFFPQVAFQASLPMVRNVGDSHEVLEPIFAVFASTNGNNPGEIPNEDSQDFEFDETHLFDADRFTGLDRVDSGQRVDYGVKWTSFEDDGSSLNVFLGQSIRLGGGDQFDDDSGLQDDLSDAVGRIQFMPFDSVDLVYRFRVDTSDLAFERNEVGFIAGPPEFTLAGSYTFLDAEDDDEFGDREEIAGTLSSQITDYWSTFLVSRYDIEAEAFRIYGGGLTYEDECLILRFSAIHNTYHDDEIKPSTDFLLQFSFKTLGDFGLPF